MKNNKMMVIEPSRGAVVVFRDIGVDQSSGGDWRHEMPMPPQSIMSKIMLKAGIETFEKLHPDDARFHLNKKLN